MKLSADKKVSCTPPPSIASASLIDDLEREEKRRRRAARKGKGAPYESGGNLSLLNRMFSSISRRGSLQARARGTKGEARELTVSLQSYGNSLYTKLSKNKKKKKKVAG